MSKVASLNDARAFYERQRSIPGNRSWPEWDNLPQMVRSEWQAIARPSPVYEYRVMRRGSRPYNETLFSGRTDESIWASFKPDPEDADSDPADGEGLLGLIRATVRTERKDGGFIWVEKRIVGEWEKVEL